MQRQASQALRRARRAVGIPLVGARTRAESALRHWQVAAPDFVGVGAQRAGTSWWHRVLDHHPDVHDLGPFSKELHYFDRFWQDEFGPREIDEYRRRFARPAGEHCGEWTPRYMYDRWTPSLLRRAAPDARLLVLLRDPVSRLVSGITHARERGRKLDETIVSIGVARGFYHQQLTHLLRSFPREQVLVLQLEGCVADPPGQLRRTLRFLGLRDDVDLSAHLALEVNTRKGEPVRLPPRVLADVKAALEPDVRRLADDFAEVDLSLWPNFTTLG